MTYLQSSVSLSVVIWRPIKAINHAFNSVALSQFVSLQCEGLNCVILYVLIFIYYVRGHVYVYYDSCGGSALAGRVPGESIIINRLAQDHFVFISVFDSRSRSIRIPALACRQRRWPKPRICQPPWHYIGLRRDSHAWVSDLSDLGLWSYSPLLQH